MVFSWAGCHIPTPGVGRNDPAIVVTTTTMPPFSPWLKREVARMKLCNQLMLPLTLQPTQLLMPSVTPLAMLSTTSPTLLAPSSRTPPVMQDSVGAQPQLAQAARAQSNQR
jgi:hypothetical protein